MKLSLVVATMNRPEDLEKALNSVANQGRVPDEVIIVDQSTDARTAKLALHFGSQGPLKARVIFIQQTVPSLVRARNRGVSSATGDLIGFIDDDVVLSSDYYKTVIDYFVEHPDIGAIGGSVMNISFRGLKWRLRQLWATVFLINFWNGRMTPSGFGYPIYHRSVHKVTPVDMLHGCNMTIRRSALPLPWFDETFTGYSFREDAEFSYRVSRTNKVIMMPQAQLCHFESKSGRLSPQDAKRMEIRNLTYVWRKHKGDSMVNRALFRYSLGGLQLMDTIGMISWRFRDFFRRLEISN